MLSVCMVTYNHEKWIARAIEGVLLQQTSFPIELIIGEDCSTDNTRRIIQSFSSEHPEIIKAFFNKNNLGLAENFSQLLNKCNGVYIAICEGDDFWTDPQKLQKQVDFLKQNPDCIITSHNSRRLYETDNLYEENIKFSSDFYFEQERFLKEWVTQPLTVVFKNIFRDYTLINREKDIFCDVILFYELLKHGNGYFMKENMGTFRVHQTALSSGLSRRQWLINHIIMFDFLYKYNRRDKFLLKISRNYCLSLFIYNLGTNDKEIHDFKPLKEYIKRTPDIMEGLITIIFRLPYYFLRHGILNRIKQIFR